MKSNVDDYDVRCTESRDALTVNVVKDATLSSRFQVSLESILSSLDALNPQP